MKLYSLFSPIVVDLISCKILRSAFFSYKKRWIYLWTLMWRKKHVPPPVECVVASSAYSFHCNATGWTRKSSLHVYSKRICWKNGRIHHKHWWFVQQPWNWNVLDVLCSWWKRLGWTKCRSQSFCSRKWWQNHDEIWKILKHGNGSCFCNGLEMAWWTTL